MKKKLTLLYWCYSFIPKKQEEKGKKITRIIKYLIDSIGKKYVKEKEIKIVLAQK